MDTGRRSSSRTRLRTELLWFVGVLVLWTAASFGGFAWFMHQLSKL